MKREEVEKLNETLRDEMDIAGALSRDYPDVVLLDLANDTAVTIKREGNIIAENQRIIRRSYNDTWDNYISKYVVEEERKNRTIQEEQFRIIGALSQEYSSLFKIDADTGKMSLFRTDGIGIESDKLSKMMESGNYEEVLSKYIEEYIVPEDQKRMRESTKLSVFAERVPEVGLYKLGYRRIRKGVIAYYEMNTVKTVDTKGKVTFILGLRDVDEEMRRQLKQTKEMEMQREIIEGLGMEYYSVLLVDLDTDTVTSYRAEGEDGQAITDYLSRYQNHWSKGMLSYAEELVSERSRDEFVRKLSLEHMRLDGKAYSLTYEKLTDAGIIYLQARVAFVQKADGGFVAVVGTRNVDDLIKKERQQEMALEAAFDAAEGMPISRNIVRVMGGDIQVESTPGKGSRFTVTVYLKLQDEVMTDHQKFIDLDVLVADDDEMSLESCVGMLCDLGMKAEGVLSGAEAVKQVVEHHQKRKDYFACIIDWKMPEMDGIQTTRAIRKAVGPDVPIIIISAYDWSDIEQEARMAGANAFISKPLFRSRLERTFGSLLNDEEIEIGTTPFDSLEDLDYSNHRPLLVEDNELNAEFAEEILRTTGIDIDHVWNGVEAVDRMEVCEDGYYDLIFMDIQMPKMNGYDATRAIRAMKRNYCGQVPIIAMTANAFAEDVQAAKTVGMNEHIAKPLELNILIKAMKKWIGKIYIV